MSFNIINSLNSYFCDYCGYIVYIPLCVGGSKGKAGTQLKYIPEKMDTFEMYPRKIMHIIGQ